MRRVALFSLIPVAALAAIVAARSFDVFTCGVPGTASAGDACVSKATQTATGKERLLTMACQRSCAAKVAYKESDLVLQPGARKGDLTRCPVSGVVIEVTAQTPAVAYQGRTFRLCCSVCAKRFKADPARYLAT